MKKLFILVVLLCMIVCFAPHVTSYNAPPFAPLSVRVVLADEKTRWTMPEIVQIAQAKADKYHVSRETMVRVTKCEIPTVKIDGILYYDKDDSQSRIRYNEGQIARHPNWGKVGDREGSWGPAQIHLVDNPSISKKEAVDPYWALDFMARKISQGEAWRWTCK